MVFFDNWLFHGGTSNQSGSDVRWVFNFRYLPRGQAAGRPYLPDRVGPQPLAAGARAAQSGALVGDLAARARSSGRARIAGAAARTELARAQAITREWQRRLPDETAWLRLVPARRRIRARAVGAALAVCGARCAS